jgi:hypothetical protein
VSSQRGVFAGRARTTDRNNFCNCRDRGSRGVEREMQEDAFVGLLSFFGFGRPNEPMSAVLKVVLGVMEDRAKKVG